MSFYPDAIGDFLTWGDNFVAQTVAATSVLGIPAAEVTSLTSTWDAYKSAQTAASAEATRGPVTIAEAHSQHELAVTTITLVKNVYVGPAHFSGVLTDAAYIRFGLKPRDLHNTPLSRPTDLVAFEIAIIPSGHHVSCKYRIAGSTKRGKGKYHGVEVAFIVLPLDAPAPIMVTKEWVSKVDTASPWEHIFEEAEVGKRCYITMRWENPSAGNNIDDDKGKGDWAEIQSFIVP
jgi:hypothetical protein